MTKGGFYQFGRKAGTAYRRARWVWESVAGSEEEAIKAEYHVGRDMATVIVEQTPRDPDEQVQAFLDHIAKKLSSFVRNEHHQFEVAVLVSKEPTAFALPGGFVFVTNRLIELCQSNRDELAFVVAHEMSHVIKRHSIDRLISQKLLSTASLASPGRGVLAPWIRKVGLQALERAYSRDQEFEADELAVLLMQAAGFESSASINALSRFSGLTARSDDSGLGAYFSTHPPVQDRIQRLHERFDLSN
jgi:predicted Zn-dependent protease